MPDRRDPYIYLQFPKVRQVREIAWLDWCNLIGTQITTTYKIRTKYYENMRQNKHMENPKTKLHSKSKDCKLKNYNPWDQENHNVYSG
jgi:hypothetical protein